jgi:hypothetical protein
VRRRSLKRPAVRGNENYEPCEGHCLESSKPILVLSSEVAIGRPMGAVLKERERRKRCLPLSSVLTSDGSRRHVLGLPGSNLAFWLAPCRSGWPAGDDQFEIVSECVLAWAVLLVRVPLTTARDSSRAR